MNNSEKKLRTKIKMLIWAFVILLILSGLTAFPIQWQVDFLNDHFAFVKVDNFIGKWFTLVREGIIETNNKYPFIFYGTDWLAFAHIVIGVAFVGPLRDPVRNVWVIQFGMISCLLVLPLAFICGPIRGIPFFWTLIDCSFGIFGIIPLWFCYKLIRELELNDKRYQLK